MTGFLYRSARTHSFLQTESGRTLSADMTKIIPLHVLIASTICSSQSSPGRRVALIQPDRNCGRTCRELIRQLQREVFAIHR